MKRGGTLRRTSKKPSEAERLARARFRNQVLQNDCLFARTRDNHFCEGELDPHHLIEKQFLKTHFSTLPDKWRLVYCPPIGVPLCRKAHEAVTNHSDYVYAREVPEEARLWAESWDVLYRLERECPKR